MIRMLLAAAAAFALTTAAPALACPDCQNKDCPQHKVAAADKAEKKDAKDVKEAAGCPCGKGADCKCGEKCDCPHCHGGKKAPEKKDEPKKS